MRCEIVFDTDTQDLFYQPVQTVNKARGFEVSVVTFDELIN